MDKDTEEAVAGPSEGASGDPNNIMNVAEGVIAEDGNYYIVTEGTEGDNEEVLLVVMNGDGETLETVSCVDGSGIEFLDQEQNLIGTVEQTSVSSADEGVLYQIGYTGQSTSSQVSVGNVTSDGSKVEGQYVVAGAPQLKSIEHGAGVGSQIVGGNLQTVVEGGPKLKTILPPNLVERLANKGTQGSPVSKKEIQSTSENLNTKMSKQTTLGYTTISKSIGSQTPIAKVTKNVVTIDSLKSLGNVLKSGSVSKMPQTDSRNNQIVTLQLGKAQDGRVGQSLLEKSIAMDREEMSKTADVLVELATGNSAGLMGKDKTVMGITEGVSSNVSASQERNFGSGIISIPALQRGDSKRDKVYKDVTQEEELEIILHEIENMCNKLADYDEEFIVISINKTLRSSCFSSKVGKEFLDNNPDIVERFLQYSFGKKRTDNTAVKNEKADKMAAGTTISRSTNPKPPEKKETESGSVENGNMKDKNTQNNENGHGGESVAKETRHKKKDVGTELAVTPKQSDRNIGENVEKSGRLDFSKTSLQSNESKEQMNNPLIKRVGDQSPTRRSRRFEKNKTELSPTETGKISSKKSEVSSTTKNASTKKSEGTSTVTENFGNNKTAARNSGSSKTTLSPTTRKKNCATMTDLEESENDGDNSTDHCHEKQQARENTSMLNTKQNSGLKCYKCNKNFTNKSNLKRHMKNHEKDKLFECEKCGRKFARIDTMKDHVKQVHMNFKRTRSGEHGRFRPKSVVGMRKRIKKDLDNENSSEDRDRSDVDESDSENLIDLKSDDDNWSENDSVTELMDSVDNMSDSTSLTNLSVSINRTPEKVEVRRSSRKIKSTHKDSDLYINDSFRCNICGRNFFKFSSLKLHLETHSSKNEFSCTECHESFASEDLMIAHINSTHKNQKRMSNSPKKRSSIGKGKKIKVNKNEEKENTLERKNKVKNVKIKSESGDPKALLGNVAYMMDQDLTVERKKIKTENGIADDESSEKSVGTPCEKCGQHCENIEEHMNSYHTSDIYSCEVCENVFSTLDQYRTHVLSKHITTDLSESEPNKTSPNMVKNGSEEELVSDSVCQASGSSSVDQHSRLIQTNMEEKSISEKNRPFSCEICDVTFSSKNWIDKHLKLKHNEGDYKLPILVCETCGSEFLERYTLNHHRLTHVKNPKLFECGICLGNFKTRTKLDNHDCSADGIMSVSKKPFPCKKCPLSFKTSDSLHIHYRKHFMMKTNKFCCKVCYKTFTCYVYLKRHVMYSHAQSRDYICDICGKDFKRVDTLTDHKRSHLPKDGTHKCHLCDKVFKHKYAVRKHFQNVHRNDKKNKSMADSSEFDHIFSATEYHMDDDLSVERKCYYDDFWETTESKDNDVDVSQDFPCSFCRKKFPDKDVFTEHMNEFGLNYVFCEECDKPFADFDSYKKHMLHVHYAQVSDTDTDSFVKCDICDIEYKNLYMYEKHLYRQHKGDKNLDTMLVCETCGQEFNHRNCFNHHRLSHPQNASELTCGICQSSFQSQSFLVMHQCGFDASGIPIGMDLTCKLCAISFSTSDKLHFHLRGHFMKKTDAFFCKICLKQFKMYQYLRRHVMYTHKPSKDLICEQCGKTFKRIDYLKEHMHTHLPKGEIECDICHKFFKHKRALQKHKSAHLNKGLTCETCGKQFRFRSNLKYHQLTHMDRPKNFECDKCDKKFAKRESLANHLITHTTIRLKNPVDGVRQFACPDCGKAFKRKDYLVEHKKYVHQPLDGTHKCGICNKIFKHSVAVKKHMAVHTDDKPHMCEICGQGFKQAGNMRKHRQTHSSERRFKCDECGKMFKLKEDMKKHAKRHLINAKDFAAAEKLGKVYGCEICGKKFATNLSRVVHIRTHTNERPYSCKFCEKSFKDMAHLLRHEQLHAKVPKTNISTIGSEVNIDAEGNQIQDIIEASDVSYFENGGLHQFDQAEHVIIQDIPLPETIEEVQTIKVITSNPNHTKQTIIYIPSSSL